jgi:hypothetical protein
VAATVGALALIHQTATDQAMAAIAGMARDRDRLH